MPDSPSSNDAAPPHPPRIGIPYRRASEEQAEDRKQMRPYVEAVEANGGQPRLISLFLSSGRLREVCAGLDGLVLPGSPADVDPARFGEATRPETAEADHQREQTDTALLDWAFETRKPVLAICYGTQLLNVYRGGTLVQDIRGELNSSLTHAWEPSSGLPEPHHPVRLVPGSLLARLAETVETVVNSSHHQSIRRPGQGLRVTAKSPDGVVEAVELESASHWVVGVQWHPERLQAKARGAADSGVRLAAALFRELVRAAERANTASGSARDEVEIQKNSEGR
jgi:putative glutamine amidotransferase